MEMKVSADGLHQWIRSICLVIIAASSIAFAYCCWQDVKAQRAQAAAMAGFYDKTAQALIGVMFREEGVGGVLNKIYNHDARELLNEAQQGSRR